ncbi:MAG: multifunctional CCA tRNA nucleotidyl transferase/2'3'-cyclic phosphodiesterase/2'nucleotidase/phosphatase [Acidobacteriota bacterium]
MKTYLVGGAVRDLLRGIVPQDRDYTVVGATAEEMLQRGFRQVGAAFPVFLHPQTQEEYALARRERKTGPGHQGFAFEFGPDVTLEEDLGRRDFTVNAMAMDGDTLIDPYDGEKDLRAGVLRRVSEEAFSEDPLRVLRLARFASQLGMQCDPHTLDLARAVGERVRELSAERIWVETSKALVSSRPSAFFRVLQSIDILRHFLPELSALVGFGTFENTMAALDRAAGTSLRVMVGVLLEHTGDVRTIGFRLRIPEALQRFAEAASTHGHRARHWRTLAADEAMKILREIGALRDAEVIEDFTAFLDADSAPEASRREFYAAATALARAITGQSLVDRGVQPGPALGRELAREQIRAIAGLLA